MRYKILPQSRAAAHYLSLLAQDVFKQFMAKGCQKNAAALTYVSLFALVPMLTVIYSMLSLVPAADNLWEQFQAWIFRNFVPESGAAIADYLDGFTSKARTMTLPGVALLMVTAYLMLKNIEATFNAIWSVPRGRRGLSNFLLYWAVLSLGPILLGAGLVMSTYLLSLRFFVDEVSSLGIMKWFLSFFPWVLTSGAFTLLFVAVPNCRVPFRDALIGGVVSALCFEVAKDLFAVLVSRTTYELIYGAFALFPLFLLWVYILWIIILAGAVLVRSLSHRRVLSTGILGSDVVAATRLMAVFSQRMETGGGLAEPDILSLGVTPEQWRRLKKILIKHQLIAETHTELFVLCRNLDAVRLNEFIGWIEDRRLCASDAERLSKTQWGERFKALLQEHDRQLDQAMAMSLQALFCGSSTHAQRTVKYTHISTPNT